jgi:hypothetical protein
MSNRKRTPDQEPQAETATTAVAAPPAAANDSAPAANDNKPTFAERVGQRKWTATPDPFGIASDSLAGVRLLEGKQDRQMALKFEEKPSAAVIDKLKDAGYHWNPVDRIWAHPVRSDSAMSTRIDAERLYQEVRMMIRQERGIETGPEVPF